MTIWNELRCDCCGMRSPAMKNRPRATLIRKTAAKAGWSRIEVLGAVRDICPTCRRFSHEELERCVHFAEPLEEIPPSLDRRLCVPMGYLED